MPHQVLISRQEIEQRIRILAREIREKIDDGTPVAVLLLLNGALMFGSDLLRELPAHFIVDTLRVSSYGMETTSSGQVKWGDNWPDFTGKKVLVVDDVLDTGHTLQAVCNKLREKGALQVYTAVAVDKKGQRQVDCDADFVGFTAGHEFLVGYGMDYAEKYRNLPYIAVLTGE